MAEADDAPPIEVVDPEMRQLLGMFDTPAFARRGQDLEQALDRLQARLRRDRAQLQEMASLRLRQWVSAVEGPDCWPWDEVETFERFWFALGQDAPPCWGKALVTLRRRRALARDLAASVARFNRRWPAVILALNLDAINRMIDQYNTYYLLEKECVFRSSRLAARHFVPYDHLTHDGLLAEFPLLPELHLLS